MMRIHTFSVLLLLCLFTLSSPANTLEFNFPGLEIGIHTDKQAQTGVTVFYFPKQVRAAVDLRGGAIGSYFTEDPLQNGQAHLDAIVFCGGSLLGLESVSGVMQEVFKIKQSNTRMAEIPRVSGVCIYDFSRRESVIYPDKTMGINAFQARSPSSFEVGRVGAGTSAHVGKLWPSLTSQWAGQGAAFDQINDIKIAVFTIVNSVGVILDTQGHVQFGPDVLKGRHYAEITDFASQAPQTDNTTLTLVVTNAKLTEFQLKTLSKQIQQSLSQVIFPYSTDRDGDVLYLVTTDETENTIGTIQLGMKASVLAHAAIRKAFSH